MDEMKVRNDRVRKFDGTSTVLLTRSIKISISIFSKNLNLPDIWVSRTQRRENSRYFWSIKLRWRERVFDSFYHQNASHHKCTIKHHKIKTKQMTEQKCNFSTYLSCNMKKMPTVKSRKISNYLRLSRFYICFFFLFSFRCDPQNTIKKWHLWHMGIQ